MVWNLFDRLWMHGEEILRIAKVASLGASIVGAYYFASYLAALDIPFPLDLAVLPAALLAIGLVTAIITGIILVYLLMAGWAQADPLDIRYAELIHTQPSGLIAESRKYALINITAIFVVPFVLWLLFLFYTPKGFEETSFLILLGIYVLWSCLVGLVKGRECSHANAQAYLVFAGKVAVFTFFVSFLTVASSLVYIAILAPRGLLDSEYNALLAFLVFVLLNTSVLYPYLSVSRFNKENASAMSEGASVEPNRLSKRIYGSFAGLAVIALVVATLFPPLNSFVGELTLRLLGLSTTTPRVLHASKATADVWPTVLVNECENGRCASVPVAVVLDLGNTFYVRPLNERDRVFRLQRVGIIEEIPQAGYGDKHESKKEQKPTRTLNGRANARRS